LKTAFNRGSFFVRNVTKESNSLVEKELRMIGNLQTTPKTKFENKKNTSKNINFKAEKSALVKNLVKNEKLYHGFIKQRENLSNARFIQDVTTNWVPKVIFTRSLADFTEMSFLEYTESALFYFAPALLCGFFLNALTKIAPKNLRNEIKEKITKKPTEELLKDATLTKSNAGKRVLPIKAAIVLACVAIPAAEYALSFAKNLLTLKVFKKSNFNNIVNLNKDDKQVEDKEHQEKVKKSANKHIKNAAAVSAVALSGSVLLATVGHKSEALQKISKGILRPGNVISKILGKFGIKSEKLDKNLNTYINFDCGVNEGKPVLSKGQLVVSTVVGLFGYSAAGKDRGKLDQLEVLTRVPVVVLYTIFGSEAFDWAFKHILLNKNKYPDLIKRKPNSSAIDEVPDSAQLEELSKKLAKIKKTPVQKEFNRLVKEKAIISAAPYGFSLVFMGFLLAGITRFWTQYRFNHGEKTENKQKNASHVVNFQKGNSKRFSWVS